VFLGVFYCLRFNVLWITLDPNAEQEHLESGNHDTGTDQAHRQSRRGSEPSKRLDLKYSLAPDSTDAKKCSRKYV